MLTQSRAVLTAAATVAARSTALVAVVCRANGLRMTAVLSLGFLASPFFLVL